MPIRLFSTNYDSFQRAKQWVKELQRQGNTNIVIALAGNKSDLSDKRKVDPQEAQSYSDDNGILFMETSAKTGQNVNEVFVAIAKKLPKEPRSGTATSGNGSSNGRDADTTSIVIPRALEQDSETKKKPCCGN